MTTQGGAPATEFRRSIRLFKGRAAAFAVLAGAMTLVGHTLVGHTLVGHERNTKAASITVNAINKGDRLVPAAARMPGQSNSTPAEPSGLGVPVGCEPAFSAVADPARARLFGRCAT